MSVIVCPAPSPVFCPTDAILCVGFGMVLVDLDGEGIYGCDDEGVTLETFEIMARRFPGKWEVTFVGPLSDATYERKGPDCWVLTRRGQGFA